STGLDPEDLLRDLPFLPAGNYSAARWPSRRLPSAAVTGQAQLARPLTGLLAADVISTTGTEMTAVALPWFVLVSTGSPTRMGPGGRADEHGQRDRELRRPGLRRGAGRADRRGERAGRGRGVVPVRVPARPDSGTGGGEAGRRRRRRRRRGAAVPVPAPGTAPA